ncbi:MAG: hypothetical protein JXB14_05515 [Candidatus Altiarchaeota archaeon]|nr:hypothetical protein [Candidatus Altiarchaeota archaeon]
MVSKSVWNLPGGPWERLFAGTWHKFNVAVYENKDKVLLTTIFPKTGEISWIMVRVDKILLVPDNLDTLIEKLADKNMQIIKQQIPGRHAAYLVLLTPPTTIKFGSKAINAEVLEKVEKVKEDAEEIKQIAARLKVEVLDLKDAPHRDSASILGNPTLLLGLLEVAPDREEPKKERITEIPLGKDENGVFQINEEFFNKFISVRKGTGDERDYMAQLIAEAAILDPSPIPLIFDFGESPLKLDQANPYPYNYLEYNINARNTAFNLSSYDLSAPDCPIRMNMNEMSPQLMWTLLGIGKDEASALIMGAFSRLQQTKKADNIDVIVDEVRKTQVSNDREKFFVSKAVRILRLAKKTYGPIFSSKSDLGKLIAGWVKGNETCYVVMSRLDEKARLAFLLYFLETIEGLMKSSFMSLIEQRRVGHLFSIFLDIDWMGNGLLQREFVKKLVKANLGSLFVGEDELPMEIESRILYRFVIVGPKTVKLYTGGRGKSFDVRPLLSCPP